MTANPIEDMPQFALVLHPLVLQAMYEGAALQLAVSCNELSRRKFCRITGMTPEEADRHLRALLAEANGLVEKVERLPVPLGVMWGRVIQAIEDGRVEVVDPTANNHGRAN